MTEREINALVETIVEDLFTGLGGEEAQRLVLMGARGLHQGSWSKLGASMRIKQRIEKWLELTKVGESQ